MVLCELRETYKCNSAIIKLNLAFEWPSKFSIHGSANLNKPVVEDECVILGGKTVQGNILPIVTLICL